MPLSHYPDPSLLPGRHDKAATGRLPAAQWSCPAWPGANPTFRNSIQAGAASGTRSTRSLLCARCHCLCLPLRLPLRCCNSQLPEPAAARARFPASSSTLHPPSSILGPPAFASPAPPLRVGDHNTQHLHPAPTDRPTQPPRTQYNRGASEALAPALARVLHHDPPPRSSAASQCHNPYTQSTTRPLQLPLPPGAVLLGSVPDAPLGRPTRRATPRRPFEA